MDARRKVLKNQGKNASHIMKNLENFPTLNLRNSSSNGPSFATVVKKGHTSSQLLSGSSTKVNELLEAVLSSPNLELLLQRLFQTISLYNKNILKRDLPATSPNGIISNENDSTT